MAKTNKQLTLDLKEANTFNKKLNAECAKRQSNEHALQLKLDALTATLEGYTVAEHEAARTAEPKHFKSAKHVYNTMFQLVREQRRNHPLEFDKHIELKYQYGKQVFEIRV